MEAMIYILFSENCHQYYTGSTEKIFEVRLAEHLEALFPVAFTSKAKDWQPYLLINCIDIRQARNIELHIKKQKSSTYITNLKKYPEMVERLILRFADPLK